jgi:tellurite resistance protein
VKLSKDVFRALAAVAWADGAVKPSEAQALLRAARGSGLTAGELVEIERATRERIGVEDLRALDLSGEEAEFAYAMACMMSAADGVVDASERACVAKLGDLLGLSEEARLRAAGASVAIAENLGLEGGALEALTAAIEQPA